MVHRLQPRTVTYLFTVMLYSIYLFITYSVTFPVKNNVIRHKSEIESVSKAELVISIISKCQSAQAEPWDFSRSRREELNLENAKSVSTKGSA